MSANVDLKELRQNASELVRRAQAGEEFTITVARRPSSRLAPSRSTPWRRWDDIAELFAGPADTDREHDRKRVGDEVRDPWAGR